MKRASAICLALALLLGGGGTLYAQAVQVDSSIPDYSRTSGVSGPLGLGLSIVKHLMRLHGGRVRVGSEFGAGSVFFLEFPRDPATRSESDLLESRRTPRRFPTVG
jgi:phosphoglycerate-specific signal transduction histidine kinase